MEGYVIYKIFMEFNLFYWNFHSDLYQYILDPGQSFISYSIRCDHAAQSDDCRKNGHQLLTNIKH